MSYSKNIISGFIAKIFNIATRFVVTVLVARSLSTEDYGYVNSMILIFLILGMFGHFGINDATSYFQKKSTYDEEEVVSTNLTFVCLAFLFISVTILILYFTGFFLQDYNIFYILAGLFLTFGALFDRLFTSTYISGERIVLMNKLFVSIGIIHAIVITALWLFSALNVQTYVIVYMLRSIASNTLLIKFSNLKFAFSFNLKLIKDELKYGVIVYISALAIYLNYRFDQILIKHFMGNASFSLYSIGVGIAELVLIIPTSITQSYMGKLLNTDHHSEEFKSIAADTIKYSTAMLGIVVVVVLAISGLIPLVYGIEYAESVSVVRILLIGVFFVSIGKLGSHYFVIKGKPIIHLYSSLFILAVNLVLNVILIPRIGIDGAAIASTFAYMLYGLLYVCYFIKFEKISFSKMFFISGEEMTDILMMIKNKIRSLRG